MSDEWERPETPPPPLFLGKKERDLVKQINDELIEKVIGQQILYYPIDMERTDFHDMYGEAVEKTYLPPIRVYALVNVEEETTSYLSGVCQNIGTRVKPAFVFALRFKSSFSQDMIE